MECYKRLLLVTVISLLKSFLFSFFFSFFLKKKKTKKKKNQSTHTSLPLFSSLDEFSKYVTDNYSRLAPRSKKKTSRCRSFHPAEWNPVSTLSFLRRTTLATGLHRDSFVQSPPLSRPLFHPFHEPLSARHLTTLARCRPFRFFFP